MAGSSRLTLESANLVTAIPCDKSSNNIRAIDAISFVAKQVFETKRAAHLAARSGAKTRMAEYWLAKKFDISGDALANLLCSDIGFEILEQLIHRAKRKPDWWKAFKHAKETGEVRRQVAEANKRLAQLEMQV